mgnify:FL=1
MVGQEAYQDLFEFVEFIKTSYFNGSNKYRGRTEALNLEEHKISFLEGITAGVVGMLRYIPALRMIPDQGLESILERYNTAVMNAPGDYQDERKIAKLHERSLKWCAVNRSVLPIAAYGRIFYRGFEAGSGALIDTGQVLFVLLFTREQQDSLGRLFRDVLPQLNDFANETYHVSITNQLSFNVPA